MIETVTYTCRVQRWSIPKGSPWLPQKWTMKSSRLSADVPSGGRGVPARVDGITKGNRTTWCWDDKYGTPQKVVCIMLPEPVTKEEEVIYL